MAAFDSALSDDSEARRLAVEVIATLVNVKRIAADQILRPAKVPDDLVRRFLTLAALHYRRSATAFQYRRMAAM
jgi:hypothetical protein